MLARLFGIVLFRVRCFGRIRIPTTGPVLVCANHQSFLDPVLVGLACDRRLNYLARESLFRVPLLRHLISFLDAIPIDREGLSLTGIRESLRRIRGGEMVLIFPEGTRTADGRVGPLEPGFCALARRGAVTVLPVGIDGAFDAWPRSTLFPRPSVIHIHIGEPLTPEFIRQTANDSLINELELRIRQCHTLARNGRRR
jgi:1-acyl-sn-glycerol-3-phosphate acyltransferase